MDIVGLHSGEWGVGSYMMGVLSYMVGSVELHGGECWVRWWLLGYMVEIDGLYCEEYWVILWEC